MDGVYLALAHTTRLGDYHVLKNNCCDWARKVINNAGDEWPIHEDLNYGQNPRKPKCSTEEGKTMTAQLYACVQELVALSLCALCSIHLAATDGCAGDGGGARARERGCVLGYDLEGVAFIRLAGQSQKQYLMKNSPGHVARLPVWNPEHNCLYHTDSEYRNVLCRQLGEGIGVVVFTAPEYQRIDSLAVMGAKLLILLQSQDGEDQLVLFDPHGRDARVLMTTNLDGAQPVEPVGQTAVLAARLVNEGDSWHDVVVQVNLADGATEDVIALRGRGLFRVSPSGETLFVVSLETGDLYCVRLPARRMEKLVPKNLPGYLGVGNPVCFAGENHVVLWRERSALSPLGMYALDLTTGQARRVSREHLHDMTYVPDYSVFENAGLFGAGIVHESRV